jgi:hypothetical protein
MTDGHKPSSPMLPTSPRHRHERSSWLIAGGHIEWCYQCGAWRQLRRDPALANAFVAASPWQRPSGIGGVNPVMKEKS